MMGLYPATVPYAMESRRPANPSDVQRRIYALQQRRGLSDRQIAEQLQISPASWRRTYLGRETRAGRGKDFRGAVDGLRQVRRVLGAKWEDILGED
jgi:transcriptional regulator with XRE-family HTH domain